MHGRSGGYIGRKVPSSSNVADVFLQKLNYIKKLNVEHIREDKKAQRFSFVLTPPTANTMLAAGNIMLVFKVIDEFLSATMFVSNGVLFMAIQSSKSKTVLVIQRLHSCLCRSLGMPLFDNS